jgi:hypothetical protein
MSPSDFWALLWGPGYHEIQCSYSEGRARIWMPCDRRRPFTRIVGADDCFVSAVPRTSENSLSYGASHILWARLDRPDCAGRLARLPVAPTLVVREGRSSRRYALWALSRPLSGDWIDQANARLSHACQGRRGAGSAASLILSPFTRITSAKRAVRVYVEYESESYATAREIVGRLSDAPATDGWKQAA